MKRMMLACMLTAAMVAASSGCRGGSTPGKFVYTPVPYTVYPAVGKATAYPVAIAPNGDRYIASQVIVGVTKDRTEDFERWARSLGFSTALQPDSPFVPWSVVVLKVPDGSAIDAVELIRKQKGVQYATIGYLLTGD
jgi:hypothetical protein